MIKTPYRALAFICVFVAGVVVASIASTESVADITGFEVDMGEGFQKIVDFRQISSKDYPVVLRVNYGDTIHIIHDSDGFPELGDEKDVSSIQVTSKITNLHCHNDCKKAGFIVAS